MARGDDPRRGDILLDPSMASVPGPHGISGWVTAGDPLKRRGQGLRVRLSWIEGVTNPRCLREPLWFPAGVLEEFSVDAEADHDEYDTIESGQFSNPGPAPKPGEAPKLRTTEIETAAFYGDSPILTARGIHPLEVRDELRKLLVTKSPVNLLITLGLPVPGKRRRRPELKMKATVRSVRRSLRHGQRDTRYYTVRFVEWRDPEIERRRLGSARDGQRRRHGTFGDPVKHKLDGNDTLESLAKRYYGTANAWRGLAAAKGIKSWGRRTPLVDTKRWKVGDRITIPEFVKSGGAGVMIGRDPVRRVPGGGVIVTAD